ncbi:MAG: ferrous iron transport protein B [Candidatus Aminicenantes bacterium]|nr:ferrous iron transport protein B [Candidatus Aminicenantes bacterium]
MTSFKIVLVGQPNAGKSTLFNVLSDIKAAAANFAGTSVKITQSSIQLEGRFFQLLDLPGIYSLNASDDAEKITQGYLLREKIDLIVNVVDSTLLARSLELTSELLELGLPMAIALNMQDEAEKRGLKIDHEKLEKALGVPVVPTAALHGKGVRQLMERCSRLLNEAPPTLPVFPYTAHIETLVQELAAAMPEPASGQNGNRRFYAIKSIENPAMVPQGIRQALAADSAAACAQIRDYHQRDCFESVAYERHHLAMKWSEEICEFVPRKTIHLHDRLDRFFLHPLLGRFFLLAYFLVFYAAIFFVGNLLSRWLDPLLNRIPPLLVPLQKISGFLWLSADGLWQGVAGSLGVVLPYFLPLIFLNAIFEDSGYLSRIAFLLDGLLHRIGLHGKSVAAFILGFGCTAPALYATRILENKRDRVLSALLLPFIPCSARNAVIFALTAALAGPVWALVIYFFVLLVIAVTGKTISLFLEKPSGLIMEIPDLKVPSLRNALANTGRKLKEFAVTVVPLLLLGSVAMSWLGSLNISAWIDSFFAPLLNGVLGLPTQLGTTLIFGFFRKELIVVMVKQALGAASLALLPLTLGQAVVFLVFVTLYFPCFTTFVVMGREFGWKTAGASAVLSIVVASLSAYLFRILFLIF